MSSDTLVVISEISKSVGLTIKPTRFVRPSDAFASSDAISVVTALGDGGKKTKPTYVASHSSAAFRPVASEIPQILTSICMRPLF